MKKCIIIAGVPRAGKSTVSQIIAKKFGYQHISMDSIIAGIEKVFPETNIDTEAPIDPQINLEHISAKIAPFIRAMLDSGEYNECDYGIVVDVYQLLPRDYVTYIGEKDCEIYYFLSSDTTAEERFKILKMHDTPNDYTYFHSDEENQRDCVDIVNISKIIKEQCIQYGLPYYETSHNREKVLNDFVDSLIDTNEKRDSI
ncbi:MAG: hypothetical protein E7261_09890 [Lachnospiraceae bacterium]|nr:hypothetical protein [Lachnospiraceae bacterium]